MRSTSILLVTTAMLAAFGIARADNTMPKMDMDHGSAKAGETPAGKAFAQTMRAMMKAMATTPTGDTDRDFVIMMMPHHQGAIDMAKVELKYGKDPMLLKLAADIVRAQDIEIAEMKMWLARQGR